MSGRHVDQGNVEGGNYQDRSLSEIRRELRLLDHEILGNLARRVQLAKEAGAVKIEKGTDLRDEEQEEKALGHLKTWVYLLPVTEEMVEDVWEQLFKHCLRAQEEMTVVEEQEVDESSGGWPDPDRGTSEYWWMRKKRTDDWEVVRVDGRDVVHSTTTNYMQDLEELPDSTEWKGPIDRPASEAEEKSADWHWEQLANDQSCECVKWRGEKIVFDLSKYMPKTSPIP